MSYADLFVGAVATGIGVWAIYSALFNYEWSYQLHKARWLEDRVGRSGARVVFALVGIALIAMGAAIAMGFAPNKSHSPRALRVTGPSEI